MPEHTTSAGQPGTYAGPGLQGPPGRVLGLSKPFGEIVAPVVPFIILMACVSLLVAKNRDARRLWVMFTWVGYVFGLLGTAYVLRTILMVWRIR